MADGYFGTVYPYKPSFISDGEYRGVLATGTEGGTGKSLVIRVSRNGVPLTVTFTNLAWVNTSQQIYRTTLVLDSNGAGYEGVGLSIEVNFLNSSGTPVSDTNNLMGTESFTVKGKNYRVDEQIGFNDGVVSGTATITSIDEPQFSVLQVLDDGTDYTNEDTLTVTKDEFLRVNPSAHIEGTNLGIPFFRSRSSAGSDVGAIIGVEYKNNGFESPFRQGIYYNLPITGGTGSGAFVDVTIVGSGGSLTSIGEKSGWGIPANTSEIVAPTAVALTGGSGVGASIRVGLRKVIENSTNKQNPDYAYGFYTDGVATGGVGYETADELVVTRQALIDAGFELNFLHAEEPIAIRGVSTPSIDAQIKLPGTGYTNGEVVSVSSTDLETAGIILNSSETRVLSLRVRTLNEYGYPGVPSRDYTNFSSAGISLGFTSRTTKWDAKDGILSERTTWSTGDGGRPAAPESSGAPTIPTKEGSTTITIRSNGYDENLEGAGPYVLQESMPVPLYVTEQSASDVVSDYSNYLKKFTLGDYYGTSIQEGVRMEVYQNWMPNMPFRYVDPFNDKISAMRMDATTWSVDVNGAVFTTNGIWIGESNGALGISPNVQGLENAPTAGFADTTGLPYPAQNTSGTGASGTSSTLGSTVTIQNETYVDFGGYVETIDVYVGRTVEMDMTIREAGQVVDFPVNNVFNNITTVVYLRGEIVTAGDTIDATNNGGIPAAQGDTLLTDDFTFVVEDLFDYA